MLSRSAISDWPIGGHRGQKLDISYQFQTSWATALPGVDYEIAHSSGSDVHIAKVIPTSLSRSVSVDIAQLFGFREGLTASPGNIPVESSVWLQKDLGAPAEFVSGLFQDRDLPTDNRLAASVDALAPASQVASVEKPFQMEWIGQGGAAIANAMPFSHSALVRIDLGPPASHRDALAREVVIRLDHRGAVAIDNDMQTEWLAPSLTDDVEIGYGWSEVVVEDRDQLVSWQSEMYQGYETDLEWVTDIGEVSFRIKRFVVSANPSGE